MGRNTRIFSIRKKGCKSTYTKVHFASRIIEVGSLFNHVEEGIHIDPSDDNQIAAYLSPEEMVDLAEILTGMWFKCCHCDTSFQFIPDKVSDDFEERRKTAKDLFCDHEEDESKELKEGKLSVFRLILHFILNLFIKEPKGVVK